MPKKPCGYLTVQEKKNPLGKKADGMSSHQIIKELKKVEFLNDELVLTPKGIEYVYGKLEKMDNVERIMIEKFILEHHDVDVRPIYDK